MASFHRLLFAGAKDLYSARSSLAQFEGGERAILEQRNLKVIRLDRAGKPTESVEKLIDHHVEVPPGRYGVAAG